MVMAVATAKVLAGVSHAGRRGYLQPEATQPAAASWTKSSVHGHKHVVGGPNAAALRTFIRKGVTAPMLVERPFRAERGSKEPSCSRSCSTR